MSEDDVKKYLKKIGAAGGKKTAARMSKAERTVRARKGGKARHAKTKMGGKA